LDKSNLSAKNVSAAYVVAFSVEKKLSILLVVGVSFPEGPSMVFVLRVDSSEFFSLEFDSEDELFLSFFKGRGSGLQ